MKTKELREKTDAELKSLIAESREKLRNLRFEVASKQLKSVREIRKAKKMIAKAETLGRERLKK